MSDPEDLIWRNPAPHAQPALGPSGKYVTFTGRAVPAPSPSPVTEPVVTEAMVTAAICGYWRITEAELALNPPAPQMRARFHDGLIAALRVR